MLWKQHARQKFYGAPTSRELVSERRGKLYMADFQDILEDRNVYVMLVTLRER
jgi:hypothetical protein